MHSFIFVHSYTFDFSAIEAGEKKKETCSKEQYFKNVSFLPGMISSLP